MIAELPNTSCELRVAGCEQRSQRAPSNSKLENRKSKIESNSKFKIRTNPRFVIRTSNLIRHSDFDFRTSRAAGFTMIELLVVIGIILILIGLFFAGAKLVTAQAKERDTRIMLETAKTMFANYQQATKLYVNVSTSNSYRIYIKGTQLPIQVSNGVASPSLVWSEGQEVARNTPQPYMVPGYPYPITSLMSPDSCGILVPGHDFNGGLDLSLRNTEAIMQAMLSVPENQTILNNLPASKRVLDVSMNIPLLLDGWGNVIIFCPGGGLTGVWVDPSVGSQEVITSEGVQTSPYPQNGFTTGVPVNNKPFFASAGPDGDMSNAHAYTSGTPTSDMTDDNIYSFQN
jgi:prepilin-type N-terminal cleavage/methylation domain-containing protein